MFYWILLGYLCACTVTADVAHTKVTCNSVTPLQNIPVEALKGHWVAVESVAFNAGHPFNPPVLTDDPRTKTCIYAKNDDVKDTGLIVKLELHTPGKDMMVDVNTLTAVENEKGRYNLHSTLQDREGWQFVVLEADPTKYLVYMVCEPANEAGERYPKRVNLMARHAHLASEASISADEITTVRDRIAEKLGFKGENVVPVHYSKHCWSTYAET